MFQELVSYFKNRFAPLPPEPPFQPCVIPPVWNNPDHLKDRWEKRSGVTSRTLGTAGEALKTVKECKKVFSAQMECWKSPFTGKHYCVETDSLQRSLNDYSKNKVLGDFNNVSRIFDERFRVGYIIDRDPISGMQKETLEDRHCVLVVLRFEGRIISAYHERGEYMLVRPGLTTI